jgi:hypothetical protein
LFSTINLVEVVFDIAVAIPSGLTHIPFWTTQNIDFGPRIPIWNLALRQPGSVQELPLNKAEQQERGFRYAPAFC